MASRRNPGTNQARRKRRPAAPWGKLLGGKPIERQGYVNNKMIDLGEYAQVMQFVKMRTLMGHYNIEGGHETFPIRGLASPNWLPWYQLALAIASELDDSLKVVDAKRPGKTASRWRGVDGALLLDLVDIWKMRRPKRSVRWCLDQVQKEHPEAYGQMSLKQLQVRYIEANRHHRVTKAARYKKGAS
jgi:hypothetical protein